MGRLDDITNSMAMSSLFIVMLPKAHLTSHSMMSGYTSAIPQFKFFFKLKKKIE